MKFHGKSVATIVREAYNAVTSYEPHPSLPDQFADLRTEAIKGCFREMFLEKCDMFSLPQNLREFWPIGHSDRRMPPPIFLYDDRMEHMGLEYEVKSFTRYHETEKWKVFRVTDNITIGFYPYGEHIMMSLTNYRYSDAWIHFLHRRDWYGCKDISEDRDNLEAVIREWQRDEDKIIAEVDNAIVQLNKSLKIGEVRTTTCIGTIGGRLTNEGFGFAYKLGKTFADVRVNAGKGKKPLYVSVRIRFRTLDDDLGKAIDLAKKVRTLVEEGHVDFGVSSVCPKNYKKWE